MTQVIDFIGGEYRNRTDLDGFAMECVLNTLLITMN